jgi:hypothetical protein
MMWIDEWFYLPLKGEVGGRKPPGGGQFAEADPSLALPFQGRELM